MKKLFISLLLGVTLVGGLVGCGNKTVVEDKEVNTPIVEEKTISQSEKIEMVVSDFKEYISYTDDEINVAMNGDVFQKTNVYYEEKTETIYIEQTIKFANFSDVAVASALAKDTEGNDKSVENLNTLSDNLNLSLKNIGVEDIKIVSTLKVGEYKIIEIENGIVTYRIDGLQ